MVRMPDGGSNNKVCQWQTDYEKGGSEGMLMQTAEKKLNFIVNNSRLEGMHCTTDEITRLKKVLSGEMSVDCALKEIFSQYNIHE